jgi:murein DD-endopeptidase MepM/ murein hydrolase activator NlpD
MPRSVLRALTTATGPLAVLLAVAGIATAAAGGQNRAPAAHAAAPAAVHRPVPRPAPVRTVRAAGTRADRGGHRPARGPVTSGYGPRWGSFHPGIDVGARYGSKVHAITDGRVVSAGWIPGYGKIVRVRAHGMVFYYPHLSHIWVRHGRVRTAQVLGRVGSTGYSTGPHLHIEIRVHGHSVNPRPILRRHGVRL